MGRELEVELVRDQGPAAGRWEMPHHGASRESCAQWGWRGHVDGLAMHHTPYQRDCRRYECPTCRCQLDEAGRVVRAAGWEHREAMRIKQRLERLMPPGRLVVHWIASPPQAEAKAQLRSDPVKGLAQLRKAAVDALRRRGFRGGVLVFHAHRIPSRWNDRTGCSDGPHFHALGDGWDDNPDDYYRSKWVVKNLRVSQDAYARALYVLSHAARWVELVRDSPSAEQHMDEAQNARTAGPVPAVGTPSMPGPGLNRFALEQDPPAEPRRGYPAIAPGTRRRYRTQAVTWFGSMSYNKAPLDEADVAESYRCRVCCRQVPLDEWLELRWARKRPPPTTEGVSEIGDWAARSLNRSVADVEDDPVVRAMVERSARRPRALEPYELFA